jgi:predicted transcriptional regulator
MRYPRSCKIANYELAKSPKGMKIHNPYKGQKINAILDKLNSNLKAESKEPICNIESVESMAKDLFFGNTNPTNVNNYKNFVLY